MINLFLIFCLSFRRWETLFLMRANAFVYLDIWTFSRTLRKLRE
ncbi:hypothetical protein HMPREF9446_03158 [Bacteroides fluxus YIT 12057]|uniref:Uncharacterized protein n=1 Tax=Bacteroides fluxus YIT 12057 TaxID=763034 RepID=F3PWM2_9BACE|nr:hypothetical protein HMPREF9446_03158 [Bacteroides fluxus YIT 12057]